MSGVLFVVCIPTYQQERKVRKAVSKTFLDVSGTSEDLFNTEDYSRLKRTRFEDMFVDTESQPVSASSSRSLVNDESTRSMETSKLPLHTEGTMEKILDELLKRLNIDNAVWCTGKHNTYYQVVFSVGSGEIIEETLRQLHECGIGTTSNSVVSVIPCSLYYEGVQHTSVECNITTDGVKKDPTIPSTWDKFVLSVRARLTVAQVVERVKADACLTFDFLVLLLIAAVVSALGLVENSTIFLVASMLISPLMGPIMAGTFGTVIEDKRLQKMGVLNELFGLSICVLVGFAFGLAVGTIDDNWGNEKLPTEEMMSRGEIRSLWVGVLIALPSGAAVAIALLGDNTGSLVGVAISASLLPPAVNAGLLWSLACVHQFSEDSVLINTNISFSVGSPSNTNRTAGSYIYFENTTFELAVLGAVSLSLTLVNIICIFVTGILVLKVKEVSPRTSGKESQFWHHDIKIARDYNKTLNKDEGKQLEQQLADELAGFADANFTKNGGRKFFHVSPEFPSFSHHFLPHHQQTWSPVMHHENNNRLTLQELESLYETVTGTTIIHSPGMQHTTPWFTIPESSTNFIPSWLRSHTGTQSHANITEPMLPTIQEALSTPVVTSQSSSRRVSLPPHDVQRPVKMNKRFVVSAVDETSTSELE